MGKSCSKLIFFSFIVPLCLLCVHVHTLCVWGPLSVEYFPLFPPLWKEIIKTKGNIEKRVCLSVREVLLVLAYLKKWAFFVNFFPSFFFSPSLFFFPFFPSSLLFVISTFSLSIFPWSLVLFSLSHSVALTVNHLVEYTWRSTRLVNQCLIDCPVIAQE